MENIICHSSNNKVVEYDRHSNAAVENATEENNGQWNFGTSGEGDDDVRGASAKALSVKGLTAAAQQDFTASSSKDSGVVVTASSSDDRKSQHSTK